MKDITVKQIVLSYLNDFPEFRDGVIYGDREKILEFGKKNPLIVLTYAQLKDSDLPMCIYFYGKYLFDNKRFADAALFFSYGATIDYNNDRCIHSNEYIGDCFKELNKYEYSLIYYKKAFDSLPIEYDNYFALTELANKLSVVYKHIGNLDMAAQYARIAKDFNRKFYQERKTPDTSPGSA